MEHIRQASVRDASRIAELIVFNYRVNFYPYFRNDPFFFDELNVLDTAAEYKAGSPELEQTWVYDDGGIIKGVIRIREDEIVKLYVEPQFQSQGIGAKLLRFAVEQHHASWLWVLEYNERGKAFYQRNGFALNGESMIEDEYVPLQKMVYRR